MFLVPVSRYANQDTRQLSRLFDDTLERFFGPLSTSEGVASRSPALAVGGITTVTLGRGSAARRRARSASSSISPSTKKCRTGARSGARARDASVLAGAAPVSRGAVNVSCRAGTRWASSRRAPG